MAELSIREIYEAALSAGFTPEQATTWTAIALAESGGRSGALNDRGEYSVGLWQININPKVRKNTWGDLTDPEVNARAAYDVSRQGSDMRPWTTTHAKNQGTGRDYRTYLDDVEAVTGFQGDDRGVESYGSALPPPLPSSGTSAIPMAYEIDSGLSVGAQTDTDQDGLVDAFERLAHTDVQVADTDKDGLSDGFEVLGSHSNPLQADSDSDELSDSAEVSLGTSPTAWDSDMDGLSDAAEVTYGSDPKPVPDADDATLVETPTVPITMTSMTVPVQATISAEVAASGPSTRDRFVDFALAQRGDRYVFGSESDLTDPDPELFDCSELTQWAAAQVGVEIPDGAMYQYLHLKNQNMLIPVEDAINTPGALLFYFSSEPTRGGGRPGRAHVAISQGDGKTIEAKGRNYGVDEFLAENRFNYAGVIPELVDNTLQSNAVRQVSLGSPVAAPLDTDDDGLSDAFESVAGTDPNATDTDNDGLADAFEVIKSQTDPRSADTDSDGKSDSFEISAGTDPGRLPDDQQLWRKDTDQDALTDVYELQAGLDPNLADTDQDGLLDSTEVSLGTDPTQLDSDSDGLTDALELQFGSDPLQGLQQSGVIDHSQGFINRQSPGLREEDKFDATADESLD
jgi:cell wall-associated NlpC family hydrolase